MKQKMEFSGKVVIATVIITAIFSLSFIFISVFLVIVIWALCALVIMEQFTIRGLQMLLNTQMQQIFDNQKK